MKGQKTGGRSKSTPNRAMAEAKEVCAHLVDDPAYQAQLRQRLLQGKVALRYSITESTARVNDRVLAKHRLRSLDARRVAAFDN